MNRLLQWVYFSAEVFTHIRDYTVKQYGDMPGDNVSFWEAQDCINQVEKYVRRFKNPARGEEERLRDMLKIAHYACMAYSKLKYDTVEDRG